MAKKKYPSKKVLIKFALEEEYQANMDDASDFVADVIEYGYVSPNKWSEKELKEYWDELHR
jgi:hypothetical protein